MALKEHEVQTYQDDDGDWRWRIVVTPGTPGGTDPDIVAVSSEGYKNKEDMLSSFFGLYFAEYNESFMTLYNEWDPEQNKVGT